MSEYPEYEEAIGSWRANSPLWPGINVCRLQRPDIRAQSYLTCLQQIACNEEESIYGHSDLTEWSVLLGPYHAGMVPLNQITWLRRDNRVSLASPLSLKTKARLRPFWMLMHHK